MRVFTVSIYRNNCIYPIDFGRVVRLFDCNTSRSRLLKKAGKEKKNTQFI